MPEVVTYIYFVGEKAFGEFTGPVESHPDFRTTDHGDKAAFKKSLHLQCYIEMASPELGCKLAKVTGNSPPVGGILCFSRPALTFKGDDLVNTPVCNRQLSTALIDQPG